MKDIQVIYDNSLLIISLFRENKTLDEVIKLFIDNKINFNYNFRNNNTLNVLQENEKKCDIKISNFLQENKNRRLFLVENHPISDVFIYVVNKILLILKYDEIYFNCENILDNSTNLSGFIPLSSSEINNYNYSLKYDINDEYFVKIIKNIKMMYDYKMTTSSGHSANHQATSL